MAGLSISCMPRAMDLVIDLLHAKSMSHRRDIILVLVKSNYLKVRFGTAPRNQ
jgi:hypothetical protein